MDTEKRRTPGGWYLVGVGLVGTAIAMAITGFMQMTTTVTGMQRVVVPGKATVVLTAGRSTLYAEHHSMVSGVEYTLDGQVTFECKLHREGSQLELTTPRSTVSYNFGGYAGHNAFDVMVPAAGEYTLECTSPKQLVVAIGGGVGAWVIVALVGLLPGLAGLTLLVVVFLKRRRQR